MPVYYVERDYKIELVYLTVKCPECELNIDVTAFSNQKQISHDCKCCGHMFEIKIVVCPECNSSANVAELTPKEYYCNTCEKLVMNDNI